MKFFVFVSIMLVSGGSFSQIYKCAGANGKVNFSDEPCIGAGSVYQPRNKISEVKYRQHKPEVSIDRNSYPSSAVSPKKNIHNLPQPCKYLSSTKLRSLTIKDKIIVGMKDKDVIKSWGQPTKVNYYSNRPDEWIYRYKTGVSYVYIENGCVSSWQVR